MKKGDILLIIIAAVFLIMYFIPARGGEFAVISINGEFYKRVPLDRNSRIDIESEFGKNTVVIENGEVFVVHSDCPDKLCEKERINTASRSIVCLPNRLSIIIEGEKQKEEIDVIV